MSQISKIKQILHSRSNPYHKKLYKIRDDSNIIFVIEILLEENN